MPINTYDTVRGIRWTVTIDPDNQTVTAVAHEPAGDYRLEVPLDFVVPINQILTDLIRQRRFMFPLAHTRRAYMDGVLKRT